LLFLNGKHVDLYTGENQCQCILLHNENIVSKLMSFNGSYSFRGQSNAEWSLKTSIERFIENNPTSIPVNRIEERLLENFKQKATFYLNSQGIQLDSLDQNDILALMQHHGAPTRMLDFSESIIIAIAFAVIDDSINDSAVFAVRRLITETNSDANDFIMNMLIDSNNKGQLSDSIKIPKPTAIENKIKTYFAKKPCLRNINQKGYFLYPETIDIPFENVLSNNLGLKSLIFGQPQKFDDLELSDIINKSTVLKLIIPKEFKGNIRNMIFKNTSMVTLFPGIEGVAKSLYEIDTTKIV